MSDVGGGGDAITLDAMLDPAAATRLQSVIENAVATGFSKGFTGISAALRGNAKFAADLKRIQKYMQESFDPKWIDQLTKSLNKSETEVVQYIKALKGIDAADTTVNKAIQRTIKVIEQETSVLAKAASERIVAQQRETTLSNKERSQRIVDAQAMNAKMIATTKAELASRLQAERAGFDAAGRAQRQASQEAVIDASAAAKQRVAITRGAVEAIVRLERGLGTAISGTFRTGVSAISRVAGGIGSGIGSLFKRDAIEVGSSNSLLKSSLNERSSILKSSLTKEERILRESITRQEKSYTKLRTISSTGVTGAITGRGLGVGVGGLIAGVGLGTLFKNGFADATNYTEQLNKTRVVFGQFAGDIIKFADNSVNALGSTNAKALEALGTFGNLFRALGLSEEQSSKFSISLTTLATDLASFNNTSVDDAFQAIRSGLVGEQEPLRKFGVNLNDATLKAKALELGLYSGKGVLDANAKAQAAYALILEQTTLAQGDWARTNEVGANAQRKAKAAIEQTFSALAGQLKGVVTFIVNAAVPAFNTLTNLITGKNLSAGLTVLRDGIKGVGIALGILIAAKAGVETLQLLGAAVKLALTPFGALVVAVGLIGAAIGILYPRSEQLREAIGGVMERAKAFVGAIKDTVLPVLDRFATFVGEKVIPAVGRFLVTAFHTAVSFITGTVVPALKSFAGFVTGTVVPAVVDFGQMAVRWFGVGLDAVKAFWNFAKPFIQPAIDGFAKLGSAIARVFSGDFSKILGGIGAAGKGIGGAFANIGIAIFEALKPVGKRILDFLGDVFSKKSLGVIGSSLLDFVEAIGRFLGTHLDFVVEWATKIGLALAGAAVIVAGRFLIGFADGLRKSLPVLIGDLRDIFVNAIKGAFSGDLFSIGILGAAAFGIFKLLGTRAATSFTSGLTSGVKGTGGFLGALFGGAQNTLSGNNAGLMKGFRQEIRDTQNQLRILGSTKIVNESNLTTAQGHLKDLRGRFTDAQVAALTLRDQAAAAFRAIGTTITGAGGLLSGVKMIGTTLTSTVKLAVKGAIGDFNAFGGTTTWRDHLVTGFKTAGAGIKAAFTTTMAGLREVAKTQSMSLGMYVGKGLAVGLAAGLGGFVAGKAAGKAGANSGLTGLTTGLAVGVATGSAPLGVVAGIAATVGAELGKAEAAASRFRDTVKSLATAMKQDLGDALKSTTGGVISLTDALKGGAEGAIGEQIRTILGPDTIKILNEAGISFADVSKAIQSGDISSISDALGNPDDLGRKGIALAQVAIAVQAVTKALSALNEEQKFNALDGPSGLAALGQRLASSRPMPPVIAQVETRPQAALDALTRAPDTSGVVKAVGKISTSLDTVNAKLDEYSRKIAEAFGAKPEFEQAIAQTVVDIQNLVSELSGLDLSTLFGQEQQSLLLSGFAEEIASTISTGIADGSIQGVDDAQAAIDKLFYAATEAINALDISPEAKASLIAQLQGIFTSGITAATPQIEGAVTTLGNQTMAKAKLALAGAAGALKQSGINTVDGFTEGLKDPGASARLTAAGISLAFKVRAAVAGALKIQSPSKVMYEIGQFVTEGLADGITDTTATLEDAISKAIDSVVNKAMTKAQQGQIALRGAFGQLFSQTIGANASVAPGAVGPLAIMNAQASFTQALNGFLSAFDSNIATVFSTAQAAAQQGQEGVPPLTNAQLDIIGESLFSLNPGDVLGASNLQALTAALEAVQGVGASLLQQGVNPTQVGDVLKLYVQSIKDQAVALGLSAEGIDSLISGLGLSNASIQNFIDATQAAADAVGSLQVASTTSTGVAGTTHPLGDLLPTETPDPEALMSFLAAMGFDQLVQTLINNPGLIDALGLGATTSIYDAARAIIANANASANNNPPEPDPRNGDPNRDPRSTGTGDNTNATLPTAGTQNFYIYPPTTDVEAIALGIANVTAQAAALPGG